MKKSLFTKVLSFFIVAGALLSGTVSNNEVEKTNNEFNFETVDDSGRGALNLKSKNTVVGNGDVTALSDTKAQYGIDADGNYRIRFVTALTGDVHTLSYTLFKDGVEHDSYYVTTIYKSVVSGENTLYYDGTNFVTEATEATNDYYFACGSIVLGPSYYATQFTASLTLTKSDGTTVTSTPREASVNDLVNYEFADKCLADFETKNQIAGFTAPWGSTISYSEDIANGNGAMKMTLHNQYSIMDINGEGLGIDALENYSGINLKFYVSDTTETNVYNDTTFFRFVLVYKDDISYSISAYDVKEANTWVNINLSLGDYNQYNLKSGKFQFSLAKYVNNTVTPTGGYEGVEAYLDDIYMNPIYVPGREIVNLPYASSTGGEDIYTKVAASETGYIAAGSVAKYGIAHGVYTNYSMFNSSYLGTSSDTTKSHLTATTQYLPQNTNNDNMLTVVEATDNCYAKITVDETLLEYAFWSNIFIYKYDSSASKWITIKSVYGPSTKDAALPYLWCDYQELEAGDKLVMEVICRAGSYKRTIKYPSGVAIATPLEKGKTITLDTPTNVAVNEEFGVYTVKFNGDTAADSYKLTLLDSENNVVAGYDQVTVKNGDTLDVSSFTTGTYYAKVQAIGSGIYTNSEVSEASEFTFVAQPKSIEEVKSALLDSNNLFDGVTEIKTLIGGGTSEVMSIGLLQGETELAIAPGGTNGWCGFKAETGFSVQFLAGTTPTAFYYTYTARESGYIYLDQRFVAWNSESGSFVATVGDEVIYSQEHALTTDQTFDDTFACYLEKGETLKVQFNHLNVGARLVVASKYINISFVSSSEFGLPEGYDSLLDYIKA